MVYDIHKPNYANNTRKYFIKTYKICYHPYKQQYIYY